MSPQPLEETIQLATSELEDLARVLREAGYCVNLADPNATMLVSRLPGEADARHVSGVEDLHRLELRGDLRGHQRARHRALPSSGRSSCIGDEHFREQWHMFTCAVSPLFDQAGRIAGAVNITSCRGDLGRGCASACARRHHAGDAADRARLLPRALPHRLDRHPA